LNAIGLILLDLSKFHKSLEESLKEEADTWTWLIKNAWEMIPKQRCLLMKCKYPGIKEAIHLLEKSYSQESKTDILKELVFVL